MALDESLLSNRIGQGMIGRFLRGFLPGHRNAGETAGARVDPDLPVQPPTPTTLSSPPHTGSQEVTPVSADPATASPPAPTGKTRVPGRPNLGKILTERKVITQRQLESALEYQKVHGRRLGEALEEMHFCTDVQIARALAEQLEIPFVDLEKTPPARRFLELIPREVAIEHGVVAVRFDGNRLLVAARDPFDVRADEAARHCTRMNVRLASVPHSQLKDLLLKGYTHSFLGEGDNSAGNPSTAAPGAQAGQAQSTASPNPLFTGGPIPLVEIEPEPDEPLLTVERLVQMGQQLSTVQAVDSLIAQAIRAGASDLHIKPEVDHLRVRHRIDGRLRTLVQLPSAMVSSVIARIKILGNMDIAENRKPQDGGAQVRVDGRHYELRISTLPGIYGEVAVIRVLNNDSGMRSLSALGLDPAVEKDLRRVLSARQGMLLITGPTGSGKTTTLYAALGHLNTEDVNIITVEDPVEIKLPGVSQIQVHERAGRTFPSTLRSILRQDPDIVMVGEIRDLETAEISSRAALTGHLVLSTLHTLDTVGTLWRLMDMGIPRYIVTSSLNAVMAQRLVRAVCGDCAQPYEPSPGLRAAAEQYFGARDNIQFRQGRGCPACGGSGTRGRVGVYELLVVDQDVRKVLASNADEAELREFLLGRGMQTVEMDAYRKACAGQIPFDEVIHLGMGFAVAIGDAPEQGPTAPRTIAPPSPIEIPEIQSWLAAEVSTEAKMFPGDGVASAFPRKVDTAPADALAPVSAAQKETAQPVTWEDYAPPPRPTVGRPVLLGAATSSPEDELIPAAGPIPVPTGLNLLGGEGDHFFAPPTAEAAPERQDRPLLETVIESPVVAASTRSRGPRARPPRQALGAVPPVAPPAGKPEAQSRPLSAAGDPVQFFRTQASPAADGPTPTACPSAVPKPSIPVETTAAPAPEAPVWPPVAAQRTGPSAPIHPVLHTPGTGRAAPAPWQPPVHAQNTPVPE